MGVFAAVADGDLTQRLGVEPKGSLGELGHHANRALTEIGEAMTTVTFSAGELTVASDRIGQVSHRITVDARESSAQADVAAAAAAVSRNVQTVAAGSQEMGVSIRGDCAQCQRGGSGGQPGSDGCAGDHLHGEPARRVLPAAGDVLRDPHR